MESPTASLEATDWLLADSSTFEEDSPSELQQEADAYAADPQPYPSAAAPPSSSSSALQQEQQQQQQSDDTSAAGAFVPVDELPTFELPEQVDWQHDREAAAGAAAAATMSAVQQSAAEDVSMHLDDEPQQAQRTVSQTKQRGSTAASANGHSSSETAETGAAASTAIDSSRYDWVQQQPKFAAVAAAAAAAAGAGTSAASHSGPSSVATAAAPTAHGGSSALLLPHIDKAAAKALQSALQQQDDQQLMQEAAAVSGAAAGSEAGFGSVGGAGVGALTELGWAAAAADAAGLPVPDLGPGEGWGEDLTAVTQLKQLDLQDNAQQQQQLVLPGLKQQHQPQTGQFNQQGQQQQQQQQQGQLDLDELLMDGGSAMDLDRGAGEIPVLQQPHPQQARHDAAQIVLPPGIGQQQQRQGVDDILNGFEGTCGVNPGGVAAEAGVGPHMFGLPVEAPPVLPDEPAQLLQVSENHPDSFLL